jgi:hypothetical protein
MCSGRNGGRGNRGKGARQGSLGVIAQVAATAAPPLVTAALPRALRIDPCEKKSKRDEISRRRGERPTILPGNCKAFL